MRAALDRAGRDAEQGGNLGDGAVFDIHETQYVSLRAGEGGCDLSADEGGFGGVQAGLRDLRKRLSGRAAPTAGGTSAAKPFSTSSSASGPTCS